MFLPIWIHIDIFCVWPAAEPKLGKIDRAEVEPSPAQTAQHQEKEEHPTQAAPPSQMLTQPAPPPSQAQPQLTNPTPQLAPPAEPVTPQKAVVEDIPLEGVVVVPHEGNKKVVFLEFCHCLCYFFSFILLSFLV